MVTVILLLIIAILVGFIAWLLNQMFEIKPRGEKVEEHKPPESKPKKVEKVNSVVGSTNFEPLQAPAPKPKKVIPAEDVESAFMDNEFEVEHEPEPPSPTKLPDEVEGEVLKTDTPPTDEDDDVNEGAMEQSEIDSKCPDYDQMMTSIKKVIRNLPIDITDAEAMRALEGTSIGDQMENILPECFLKVREAAAKRGVLY